MTILMSAFSRALTNVAAAPVASKNWGPGNYIASTDTNNSSIWDKNTGNVSTQGIVQRLNSTNDPLGHWKGALLRFSWAKPDTGNDDYLESDDGTYTAGMDRVQAYLDQVRSFPGRRIIIFVQLKTSGADYHAVPLYMRNSSTYKKVGENYYAIRNGTTYQGTFNGEYAYESSNGGPGGYVPNMHVTAVKNKFIALMQAFADRFNTNPYLEAICFSEASIASPIGATGAVSETVNGVVISRPNTDGGTWADNNTWFTNMESGFTSARAALSNIQVAQWINADRTDMKTFVPNIRAIGVGVGMPDLCPEEEGFNYRNDIPGHASDSPGNIQHCQDGAGVAIVMGHASKPSLNGVVVGRCQDGGTIQGQAHVYPAYPGVAISRQATHDFAVNTVGVTHLLWAHNTGNQQATGSRDTLIPQSCQDTALNYTAYSNYGGQSYNKITDEWIHNVASTITTVETRPTGWT